MSTSTSVALDKHLKKQKPTLTHLEYLDEILGSIHAIHLEKVMEIRNTIELTLLDNPESKNEVVAYLSGVNDKFQSLDAIRKEKINFQAQSAIS